MEVIVTGTVGISTPTKIEVEPADTVDSALAKSAASQGITELGSVALSYNGKPMEKVKTLKQYGIHAGSTLELIPYHRDVGSSQHSSSFFIQKKQLPNRLKKRLAHEAKMIISKGLSIKMDLRDPLHWTMRVKGKGKWSGNTYTVEIYLNEYYPAVVPKIKFVSPINHPNIFPDSKGWICLSTFETRDWRPTYNLCTIHDSIQYIMVNPHYHWFNMQIPTRNNRPRNGNIPRRTTLQRNNGLLDRLTSIFGSESR